MRAGHGAVDLRGVGARLEEASAAARGVSREDEGRKASVRANVEHPFGHVKRRYGCAKVRYRGLAKNRRRIALLLWLSNLLIAGCSAA